MQTRAPPPQGQPPSYAFVTRFYRKSYRPVVIFTASLAGLWALLWSIASFRVVAIDRDHSPSLIVYDIILGSLYLAIFAVQVFGVVAAYLRRLPLVRLFAFAQAGAAFIVLATGIIRVVIHFTMKGTLIGECVEMTDGRTVTTRFGFFGPTSTTTIGTEDAAKFCNDAWNRNTFSEFLWLFLASILALLFASIAFTYYRQMLDPTSAANAAPRAPAGAPPAHYNPPYAYGHDGAYGGQFGAGYAPGYAPPPGPPPMPLYDGAKLPGYERGAFQGAEAGKDGKPVDPFEDPADRQREGPSGERRREDV